MNGGNQGTTGTGAGDVYITGSLTLSGSGGSEASGGNGGAGGDGVTTGYSANGISNTAAPGAGGGVDKITGVIFSGLFLFVQHS